MNKQELHFEEKKTKKLFCQIEAKHSKECIEKKIS